MRDRGEDTGPPTSSTVKVVATVGVVGNGGLASPDGTRGPWAVSGGGPSSSKGCVGAGAEARRGLMGHGGERSTPGQRAASTVVVSTLQ